MHKSTNPVIAIDTKALPSEGFVKLRQILTVFPVSQATWWRNVKKGRYPKGVRLSDNVMCWDVQDIRLLMQQAKSGQLR